MAVSLNPELSLVSLLSRLDKIEISKNLDDAFVITCLRNEMLRLPYFLEHHRKLGFKEFFIIDNGSTDGTTAYLLEQKDCHVFYTEEKFSTGKRNWLNALLDEYGTGHWCLIADGDELFVYPHCEIVKIKDFTKFLNLENSQAVTSFMIDMYSSANVREAVCIPGRPFTDICPYFDKDYKFLKRPSLPFFSKPFPLKEPVGGPRLRIFYPKWNKRSAVTQWKIRLFAKAGSVLAKLGLSKFRDKLQGPPILYKVPLVKWRKGLRTTEHTLNVSVSVSEVSSGLLHFKFFSDFHKKAATEAKRGEHYGGSVEYKKYFQHLEKDPDFALKYDGSRQYQSSADLLQANLINSTPAFETFCKNQNGVEKERGISVVMPAYNAGAYILAAIQSVQAQTYTKWELIVIDDGSTDNTLSIVENISDPRIRVLRQTHKGPSAARRDGTLLANYKYINYLDADDRIRPNAFYVLEKALNDAPDAVLAYADFIRIDHNGKISGIKRPFRNIIKPSGNVLESFLKSNPLPNGGCALVRKTAALQAGCWEDDLNCLEDWVSWVLLAVVGDFIYVPNFTALEYRETSAGLSRTLCVDYKNILPAIENVFDRSEIKERFSSLKLKKLKAKREAHAWAYVAMINVRERFWFNSVAALLKAIWQSPSSSMLNIGRYLWSLGDILVQR